MWWDTYCTRVAKGGGAWCGPCKIIAPIVEELAEEYDGKVKFVKVDTEENFHTTDRYGIRGLPALLVFKGGEQVDQIVGAQPKANLRRSLEKVLAWGDAVAFLWMFALKLLRTEGQASSLSLSCSRNRSDLRFYSLAEGALSESRGV